MISYSPDAVELIKSFESFSPTLYNCPAGHATIGYGHLVHMGPCNGSEPEEFKQGISEPRAKTILLEDMKIALDELAKTPTPRPLTQGQIDALVSFIFNVGTPKFRASTLRRYITAGNFTGVPNEFNRWKYSNGKILGGLVRRRSAEVVLWNKKP